MRLLYFIAMFGPEFLGQEIHRELLGEMIARGHKVRVFTLAGREQQVARVQPTVEDGVPVYRAPVDRSVLDRALNRLGKPVFIYDRFLSGLRHYLRHVSAHRDFDLAHVELAYPMGAIAALAGLIFPQPFVVHIGGGDLIASRAADYGYARYRLVRALLRLTFARATLVRAVSPHAAEMAERLGCPPAKLVIIQRNISRNSFPPPDLSLEEFRARARARVAARYALGQAPTIVSSGRLLPIKGFDYLIRALPPVKASVEGVRLLIVGPERGDYGERLRELAGQCGVADRVTFVGAVQKSEMREYLAAADVAAVPSIEEGGNKMVIEAAAVGTPFVATELAGTPDYTRGWDCGLIVPPRDAEALAQALIRLLRNDKQRARMGENGCVFARNFAVEPVAERLLQVYGLVLSGEKLPADLRGMPPALRRTVPSDVELERE